MGLFADLNKAVRNLPVRSGNLNMASGPVNVAMPSTSSSELAQRVGINRWGLFNQQVLELPAAENNALLQAGYLENHFVYTIADWKAAKLAEATPLVYEVKDEKSFQTYRNLPLHQKADAYALRRKSVEEIGDLGGASEKLLKRPNPAQTWKELMYALSVYYDFGNALLWGIRMDAGLNKNQFTELYLLPVSQYTGKNPTVAGYESYVDTVGSGSAVAGSDVLHLRRFNPDPLGQTAPLWGTSKLTPARRLLAKATNAVEAEAELMQNRGARAIVFPKGVPYDQLPTPDQAAEAGDAMRAKLKNTRSGGIATNSIELGHIELGLSSVDLDILKSNIGTKEDFCALWHLDANSIFSSTTTGSLGGNKQEEANKASLRSGVLPDQALFYDKLTGFLLGDYNANARYPRFIEANTDVYPELQTNKKEQIEWLEKMGSSINERREAMGYARDPDPACDIKLVPPGFTPITDFAPVEGEDEDVEADKEKP